MDFKLLRRAALPTSILLLVFLFVWSCVPRPITNLHPVSIARVPAMALPAEDYLRKRLIEEGQSVWRISLRGDAHWIDEVRKHELNSYATVLRCDQLDYELLSQGPYVGTVLVSYYGDGFGAYRPSAKTVTYDVYLPERGQYKSQRDFNAQTPSYDLARQRLHLCLRIAGGAMHGAYNRSNEVRLDVGEEH